jgi:hypothetical protein
MPNPGTPRSCYSISIEGRDEWLAAAKRQIGEALAAVGDA